MRLRLPPHVMHQRAAASFAGQYDFDSVAVEKPDGSFVNRGCDHRLRATLKEGDAAFACALRGKDRRPLDGGAAPELGRREPERRGKAPQETGKSGTDRLGFPKRACTAGE